MYPKDNIFNIYYNIGKRLPFLVKRCRIGMSCAVDEETLYSNKGRTFLVEKIQPRGIYGKAFGKCFVDGVPNNEYREQCYPSITDDEIPCAGCGEWVLVDIPNVNIDDVFPKRSPDYIIEFGKYKGKTIKEIYSQDPKYIFWLMERDHYFRIDIDLLLNILPNTSDRAEILTAELNRIYPKLTPDDIIPYGKYKGMTFRRIYSEDPNYISWFINNTSVDIDENAFRLMFK